MFDLWGRPGDTQPSLITETHSLWVLNGEWEIMEVPFWPGEYQTKHNPQEPVVRMGHPRHGLERGAGSGDSRPPNDEQVGAPLGG